MMPLKVLPKADTFPPFLILSYVVHVGFTPDLSCNWISDVLLDLPLILVCILDLPPLILVAFGLISDLQLGFADLSLPLILVALDF
ncbi:hypothetical protein CEXT_36571 [Caerostris extrusa]|uniref:Uncharacterized protein n=1 Tax=Caerostris extrusa TaxID=172846 RepID=A0AAV4NJG1_CAEEX|nr:hypothetical protein CEXT_36571 [Caerostris extrusa]